jgi:hypothetical protein
LPAVQSTGVHTETQVFVVESQIAPPAHFSPAPHVTLHWPSPESHVWPCGQRCRVQSVGGVRHSPDVVLQTDPDGQPDDAVQSE